MTKHELQTLIDSLPPFGKPFLRESIVDLKTGVEISIFTPKDGTPPKYMSQLQMTSPDGRSVAFVFEIVGVTNVEEAIEGWQNAARNAVRKAHEQAEANQRRILVPSAGGPAPVAPFAKKANGAISH